MLLKIIEGKQTYIEDDEPIAVQMPDSRTYEQKVEDYIAEKYTLRQEIALINNYNLDNQRYKEEYEAYQEYRKECKERAKLH